MLLTRFFAFASLILTQCVVASILDLAEHITTNVPGIVHTIRSRLEKPLLATRNEHSNKYLKVKTTLSA